MFGRFVDTVETQRVPACKQQQNAKRGEKGGRKDGGHAAYGWLELKHRLLFSAAFVNDDDNDGDGDDNAVF